MKINFKLLSLMATLSLLLTPTIALAYIGPGLGMGAVASILGILAGFLMLVVGVVWYPLKRLYRYFRPEK